MSILIKGMELPDTCYDCPFQTDECFGSIKCRYAKTWGSYSSRAVDCPLVPVPPHGDLIDASTKVTIQTYDDMYEEYRDEECTIAEALDRWSNDGCPEAIIPAEEGE